MATGDISQKFGTSTAITITLASLASSATAGRQSAAVDFATYIGSGALSDVIIGGVFELATGSPTADKAVYVSIGCSEDGTLFGADCSGSDAAYTEKVPTNLTPLRAVATPDSGGLAYVMQPVSLMTVLGYIPRKAAFVVRNYSGVALETTGSAMTYTPVYHNVAP